MSVTQTDTFAQRWKDLPDAVQDAVYDLKIDAAIDAFVDQQKLSDAQWDQIEHVVLSVLFGFLNRRHVSLYVQKVSHAPMAAVQAFVDAIERDIFNPLADDIDQVYAHFNSQGIAPTLDVDTMTASINLKSAQPEGTVNLKKEDAGPKILAVGESGSSGAYTSPAPRPSAQQQVASSFGPSIIQRKQDVVSPARPAVVPVPPPADKDIFSLSTKDRWGIENEDIIASRRMMGQSQVPPVQSPPASRASVSPLEPSDKNVRPPVIEKKEGNLPALEEVWLPEIVPEASHPISPQSPKLEEKRIIPPPPAIPQQKIIPPPPAPPSPIVSSPRPPEAVANQDVAKPSPVINPTISVNVQIAPQSMPPQGGVAPQQFTASAPAFSSAPAPSMAPESAPVFNQPASPVRPMQWAAPAQPPKQPDVVVEIRQMQGGQTAATSGTQSTKATESEQTPVRPMKVSPLVQSTPPAAPTGKEATLAMHPVAPSSQQPEIKKPLDPNEVVDIGPVIIHKRDDPSVAQMRSGAQYRDLSSGGFSRNFSEQSPRQSAAPSVADIQVPLSPSSAQSAGTLVDKRDQSPAAGQGKPPAGSAPAPKKGFFSFFKK